MEHPGIRLKLLREQHNLTEAQLINKLYNKKGYEINIVIIKAWEKGIANIHDDLLVRISKFFDVSIMYLLGFTSIKGISAKYNIL